MARRLRQLSAAEAARLVQLSDSDDEVGSPSDTDSGEEDALFVTDGKEADDGTAQARSPHTATLPDPSGGGAQPVSVPSGLGTRKRLTKSKRTLEEGEYVPIQQETGFYSVRDNRNSTTVEWSRQPDTQRSRRLDLNVTRHKPGLIGRARSVTTDLDAFLLFFQDGVIDLTIKYTNQKLLEEKVKYESSTKDSDLSHLQEFDPVTRSELLSFVGLSLLRGSVGAESSAEDLFTGPFAQAPFIATMSYRRYLKLLRCLRFDDAETRPTRRETDKFCLIREMFNIFDCGLRQHLHPSDDVCLDETLVRFRGRCGFKVYMPSKPGKYGVLFRSVADAEFHYIWKLWPYAGKPANPQQAPPESSFASVLELVRYMTAELRGSGRNVTMDRYFTTIEIMDDLKRDRLSAVGTLQGNRRLIPSEMKVTQGRQPGSTIACYRDGITLVSYCPKPGKVVLAASTFHENTARIDSRTGKPEIILHYNATKGGVDICDAMLEAYSTRVPTRRWTTAVFLFMIGVAALNAYHVFQTNVPDSAKSDVRHGGRRLFLQELGLALCRPQMESRATVYTTAGVYNRRTVVALESCLGRRLKERRAAPEPSESVAPGRCHMCLEEAKGVGYKTQRQRMKKVKTVCSVCGVHACDKHMVTVRRCDGCYQHCDSE